MTDETANLVLELLRAMRGDMDGLRREIAVVKDDVAVFRSEMKERLDAVDLQLEGMRYVLVTSLGSLAIDVKDHDARIAHLEGATS